MKVLEFYAPWCGPCKKVEPVLTRLAGELGVLMEKVNVEDNRPLFDSFGVRSVPTIILTNEEGEEVRRVTGSANMSEKALRELLSEGATL